MKFDVKYNGKIPTGQGAKAGFKVTGTVDRFDYGLTNNFVAHPRHYTATYETELKPSHASYTLNRYCDTKSYK